MVSNPSTTAGKAGALGRWITEPGVAGGLLIACALAEFAATGVPLALNPAQGMTVWGAAQLGVGAVAFAAGLVFLRSSGRSRGWRRVREALLTVPELGNEPDALRVEGIAPECVAWNAVLDGVLTDIDDQLHTAARESVGQTAGGMIRSACDAMSVGIIVLDQQGVVRFLNGAAVSFLHRDRTALMGQPLAKAVADPGALKLLEGVCASSPKRGAVELTRDALVGIDDEANASGAILRFAVRPLRDHDEANAVVYLEDVTQQQVASEARGQFVAHATHELRTPLTNIQLYVEELQDAPEDEALRARAINIIDQEVRRLDRTIGEMLSVSEMDAGVLSLHMGDVRWDAIFETLQRDYAASAQEHGVTLEWDLSPKLPVVPGDRIKLETSLHNLLGNAIKYTPSGGTITVRTPETPGRFSVEIEDSGIGIATEHQERIFERYGRASDDRVQGIVGTGLGLTLAREIARLHQGDVSVESELDKGSTFTLWIPLPDAQAAAA